MRLWERIREASRDFERGFTRICETLGEDLQGFVRLWERIHKDFVRAFARDFLETLGEDLQGFVRLWERIRKDLRDFGRGFARIHKDS